MANFNIYVFEYVHPKYGRLRAKYTAKLDKFRLVPGILIEMYYPVNPISPSESRNLRGQNKGTVKVFDYENGAFIRLTPDEITFLKLALQPVVLGKASDFRHMLTVDEKAARAYLGKDKSGQIDPTVIKFVHDVNGFMNYLQLKVNTNAKTGQSTIYISMPLKNVEGRNSVSLALTGINKYSFYEIFSNFHTFVASLAAYSMQDYISYKLSQQATNKPTDAGQKVSQDVVQDLSEMMDMVENAPQVAQNTKEQQNRNNEGTNQDLSDLIEF